MQQISPADFADFQAKNPKLRLIDVREVEEWQHCKIEGAVLRPLSQITQWEESESAHEGPLVIYCHHGIRSAQACARLHSLGLEQPINLAGGIDRWSIEVDSSVARY